MVRCPLLLMGQHWMTQTWHELWILPLRGWSAYPFLKKIIRDGPSGFHILWRVSVVQSRDYSSLSPLPVTSLIATEITEQLAAQSKKNIPRTVCSQVGSGSIGSKSFETEVTYIGGGRLNFSWNCTNNTFGWKRCHLLFHLWYWMVRKKRISVKNYLIPTNILYVTICPRPWSLRYSSNWASLLPACLRNLRCK